MHLHIKRRTIVALVALLALAGPAWAGFYSAGPETSSTSSTITVAQPDTISGHTQIAVLWGSGLGSVTPPTGWSTVQGPTGTDTDRKVYIAIHCNGSHDGSAVFSITGSGNGTGGKIFEFVDDACATVTASNTDNFSNQTSHTLPSISVGASESDTFLFCGGGIGTATLIWNPPVDFMPWTGSVGIFSSTAPGIIGRTSGTFTPAFTFNGGGSYTAGCIEAALTPSVNVTRAILHGYRYSSCSGQSCTSTAPKISSGDAIWAVPFAVQASGQTTYFTTVPAGFIDVHGVDQATGCGPAGGRPYTGIYCKNAVAGDVGSATTYNWAINASDTWGDVSMWTVSNSSCPAPNSGAYSQAAGGTSFTGTTVTTTVNSLPIYTAFFSCANSQVAVSLAAINGADFGNGTGTEAPQNRAVGFNFQETAGVTTGMTATSGNQWWAGEVASGSPSLSTQRQLWPFP